MRRIAFPRGLPIITTTVAMLLALSIAYASHQWNSYHWQRPDAGELTLDIGDCHTPSPQGWSTLLGRVVGDWDSIPGYGVVPTFGVVKKNCGAGDIKSYNDDYGNNGWLGLASIAVTRGKDKHIVQGESRVNEYYITLAGYGGFDQPIEWQHVLCQEIGHTFGLDHTHGDTCMNDGFPLQYPAPNYHDGEQLAEMYAHDHGGGGSGGGGGPGGGGPPGGGPPGGGPGGRGGQLPAMSSVLARAFWAERYESDEAMFEAADLVVDATVLASAFSHLAGQGAAAVPVTRVVLRVNEALSGQAPQTILLEQTRGPGLEIVDDPGYVQGDTYTLFLRQTGPSIFRTVNADGRVRR